MVGEVSSGSIPQLNNQVASAAGQRSQGRNLSSEILETLVARRDAVEFTSEDPLQKARVNPEIAKVVEETAALQSQKVDVGTTDLASALGNAELVLQNLGFAPIGTQTLTKALSTQEVQQVASRSDLSETADVGINSFTQEVSVVTTKTETQIEPSTNKALEQRGQVVVQNPDTASTAFGNAVDIKV